MRNILIFLLGGLAFGVPIFFVTSSYGERELDSWVDKFTKDECRDYEHRQLVNVELVLKLVKNIEAVDFDDFHRKACLYMKISTQNPDVKFHQESKHFKSILQEVEEYIAKQEAIGRCGWK